MRKFIQNPTFFNITEYPFGVTKQPPRVSPAAVAWRASQVDNWHKFKKKQSLRINVLEIYKTLIKIIGTKEDNWHKMNMPFHMWRITCILISKGKTAKMRC